MFGTNFPPMILHNINILHTEYAYIGLLCLFLSWIAITFVAFTSNPVSSLTSFIVLLPTDSSTSHQPPGNDQVPLFSWVNKILLSLNIAALVSILGVW